MRAIRAMQESQKLRKEKVGINVPLSGRMSMGKPKMKGNLTSPN